MNFIIYFMFVDLVGAENAGDKRIWEAGCCPGSASDDLHCVYLELLDTFSVCGSSCFKRRQLEAIHSRSIAYLLLLR